MGKDQLFENFAKKRTISHAILFSGLPVATPALYHLGQSRRLRNGGPSVYETEGLLCSPPACNFRMAKHTAILGGIAIHAHLTTIR